MTNIGRLKKEPHCGKLKSIQAATVGEDWPELREKAAGEVRALIDEESQHGRLLVIADRLYDSGPYKKLLAGLDYVLNAKGLAYPSLGRWLEEEIENASAALASPWPTTNSATLR